MSDLDERMKGYEAVEAKRRFLPMVPIIIRLDGKNFSSWTRDLDRPFDTKMSASMVGTTKHLVDETNACIGYTQSDEITLILHSEDWKSQVFFDGRVQKLCSVLASMATARFNDWWYGDCRPLAMFDCRAWQVPTKAEAANVLLWREQDATRNSVSMAASCYYSPKQLFKKSGPEMQEMLFQQGINWNNYPAAFKRGVFVQRKKRTRPFTAAEIDRLPPKHDARLNPNLVVERTDIEIVEMPPFAKIENRESVIFNGATPTVTTTEDQNEEDHDRTALPSEWRVRDD